MDKTGYSQENTTAVLVIHGIGQQIPGQTIRQFVEGVLAEEVEEPKFVSKPDRLAENFGIRKYQNRSKPRLQFFEYYWAHQSKGTTLRHVLSWYRKLLLRWPNAIPRGMKALYYLSWITLILLGLTCWEQFVLSDVEKGNSFWKSAVGLAFIGTVINGFVIGYLGDAARYLSPAPQNVSMQQAIRSEGCSLLRKLHEEGYGRIIVVGHSLGTVVGYDILRQVWDDFNTSYSSDKDDGRAQTALEDLEKVGKILEEKFRQGCDTPSDINDFQEAQKNLIAEMRSFGLEWRVTDFLTLGSPLSHAAMLMAKDECDLRRRQDEREFPTCPPVVDLKASKIGSHEYAYLWKKGKLRRLHHAAPFAMTRWTNLYFPAFGGLFGDFVGGPVRDVFGPGIKDVPVSTNWLFGLGKRSIAAHVRYWSEPKDVEHEHETSLREIRDALDLKKSARDFS